jgi:cytochrome c peroxidase
MKPLLIACWRVGLAGLYVGLGMWVCVGCGSGGLEVNDAVRTVNWQNLLPAYFPTPQVPAANALHEAKIELGRFLFYDTRLSGNGTQSCGSCHQQDKAFTDGRMTAVGSTGQMHPRNTQHLSNVVYHPTLTWANPALLSLESQMLLPLFGDNPVEMGIHDGNKPAVLSRIQQDASYPALFTQAFPGELPAISWSHIISAIASFERVLISGNSLYDRYLQGRTPLDPSQTRGMNLFFGEKAECFHCHGSFNFNDQVIHAATRVLETPFHNTGLFNIGGTGAFPEPNRGVFELSGRANDMGRFRAPSLRNVEVTAPYMHDGSLPTLAAVLDFYAAGGRAISSGPYAGDGRLNPYKSELISRIQLSEQDKADLVAFLHTLTDHEFLQNPRLASPFQASTSAASAVSLGLSR